MTNVQFHRSIRIYNEYASSEADPPAGEAGGRIEKLLRIVLSAKWRIERYNMYRHVFVAGTFDGLHAGHMAVIERAFSEGKKVTIGVTSDEFIKKFKIQDPNSKLQTQTESVRKQKVIEWVKGQELTDRSQIIPIDSPYEPAASGPYDGLVVTLDNRIRGEEINTLRKSRGLRPLALLEVSLVSAKDGQPISSTRMRKGEIDGQGNLVMPEHLRSVLAKPLGTILSGDMIQQSLDRHNNDLIVTVGDIATKTILDAGLLPKLVIVDGQAERKPYRKAVAAIESPSNAKHFLENIRHIKSGPGFISHQAQENILEWSCTGQKPLALLVDGEEDLLVLPVVQSAPLGSVVYYGQPGEGLVEVVVDEKKKKEAKELLTLFTVLK